MKNNNKTKIVKKRQNAKRTCEIKMCMYIASTDKDCDLLEDRHLPLFREDAP